MLFQLHWQNRADYRETEFVAQDEANTREEVEAMRIRLLEVAERRKGEMPDGWCQMICNEDYEGFVRCSLPAETI